MFKLFKGAQINRWTLRSLIRSPLGYRKERWMCRCECGKTKPVLTHNLRFGLSLGCGCKRGLKRKREQEVGLKTLQCIYKTRAKRKGILFRLSVEQFNVLVSQDCVYCGASPRFAKFGRIRIDGTRARVRYNGIDRVNNRLGYVEGNCDSCCMTCNIMKSTLSHKEFLDHIETILRRSGRV